MLTNEENRELAGYLEICWHESFPEWDRCAKSHYGWPDRPDFTDPRVVLREMRKREDCNDFLRSLSHWNGFEDFYDHGRAIPIVYFTEEDLLARAALDWFRKQKG